MRKLALTPSGPAVAATLAACDPLADPERVRQWAAPMVARMFEAV